MVVAVKYDRLQGGGFVVQVRRVLRNPAQQNLHLTDWQEHQIWERREQAESQVRALQADVDRSRRIAGAEMQEIFNALS